MSCFLITYKDRRKVAEAVGSREEYLALRNSETNVSNLLLARRGDAKAKSRLVQMNYSGLYAPGSPIKGNKLVGNSFPLDIDDRDEFERVSQLLLNDPSSYKLLMLERSVSQGGHAVFEREKGKTILENQVRMAMMLNTELDLNTHDPNRVFYSTSASPEDLLYLDNALFDNDFSQSEAEEEALLLEQREANGMEEVPPEAHKAHKHYRPNDSQTGCEAEPVAEAPSLPDDESLSYLGIRYSDIIDLWWKLYYDGQKPVKSNRDVLTYELALNLRHICGFDPQLLNRIIPCYDDFPPQQKMKCINSAINEKRTQLPLRLKNLLAELRKENIDNEEVLNGLEEVQNEDDKFFFSQLSSRVLPQGVRESVKAVGPAMGMAMLSSICPAIGALATGVRLDIHGEANSLNLISFVVGQAASNKGQIDQVVKAWMSELQEKDDEYFAREKEFRKKMRMAKNETNLPEEPELPVRNLSLNNTLANLAERLSNTRGKHAFSFTPEADMVAQKLRTGITDFSVMLRQAFDASAFDREARSIDAVSVHIKHLRWNVVMCGTPDALFKVISNCTDGLLSRVAIASTPDNTFMPLDDNPRQMNSHDKEKIRQIAHLLPLMEGTVVLPRLERKCRQWLEAIRLEAIKDDDRTKARCRFRDAVTAMRMVCCLMLCAVCEKLIKTHGLEEAENLLKQQPDLWKEELIKMQTPSVINSYDPIADSIIMSDLRYFRERLEASEQGTSTSAERVRTDNGESVFSRLKQEFTIDEAMEAKGIGSTRNAVRIMLYNWRKQGLIASTERGHYRKL